jgi:hypothetical protein
MFSSGCIRILRKIQLMLSPEESGNKKPPKKCHNHTFAYISTS